MNIPLCDCKSSNLAGFGYDAASKTLAVKFKDSGKTYHYADVPPDIFDEFGKAESKGKFFFAKVRNSYKAKLLEEKEGESMAARKTKYHVVTITITNMEVGTEAQTRIVEAKTELEVFRHLLKDGIEIHECTPSELHALGVDGVKIEKAGEDDAPPL